MATETTPIVQFGTSRFLQAHADLFVSEALARGAALGRITVVQGTDSPASARRVAAFNAPGGYLVRIRGIEAGVAVEREVRVDSVARALIAARDWAELERVFVTEASVVISNTGDRGFETDPADRAAGPVPRSFPARLTRLLFARWQAGAAPVSVFPTELLSGNGCALRRLVLAIGADWELGAGFASYVGETCRFANSLVDRIVPEALEPIGAVAEPYALWAIGRQDGLLLPCAHPQMVITDDLPRYARLKLFFLNLGHSYLAQRWHDEGRPADETVRAILEDPAVAAGLCALWEEEVQPVFDALGLGAEARSYRATVLERFRNPFVEHRLADIHTNHAAKKRNRMAPVVALAEQRGLACRQERLRAMLAAG